MNRKVFTFVGVLLVLAITLGSCGKEDKTSLASQEWIDYQQHVFDKVSNDTTYSELTSYSMNGSIFYKKTDNLKGGKVTKMTAEGSPDFNDTVVCRYTGWYLDMNGKKIVFDSTEEQWTNNQMGVTFTVDGVMEGWTTMLQYMKAGEEVEVCIPQHLAYGPAGEKPIKGYTTLFFNLKLLKIKPLNPKGD